jgi:cell division protease FtsH
VLITGQKHKNCLYKILIILNNTMNNTVYNFVENNEEVKNTTKETNQELEKKETKLSKNNSPIPPVNNNKKFILNLITVLFSLLVISMILFLADQVETNNRQKIRPFSELITEIRENKVSKITVSENNTRFIVDIYSDPKNPNREKVEKGIIFENIKTSEGSRPLDLINQALGQGNSLKIGSNPGEVIYETTPAPWYTELLRDGNLWYILLILTFIGVAVFFVRKVAENNSRAVNFGNSKARTFDELKDNKVTFADVAGNEEAKQELYEVVDFLKRTEEYEKMGAKIPKGVLLFGSPGNGKTLMARAVAGEANVPFLYVSGSEFVEMFVGVGAGRVRDLFRKAKKKGKCVIFIDEIDAVGRQRGTGMGGGNDEREQTLNQILVEMDGFSPNQSIIVIGATNRPDVLDPALLRPGRFDRQITVTSPDRLEREKILKIHSKNKKMAKDVDLKVIAKRTPGFSGADLMNLVNEAAILAVREKKKEIDNAILREAIEKVALGPSLKSKLITEKQKRITAYHEAGHALTATVLPKAQKVQKVTIVPRGKAAGYTFHTDDDEAAMVKTRQEFLDTIVTLFGGYTVEQIVFGDISTGASNDLAKATEIARNMVKKYGMSSLGPVSYDDDHGMTFLGRDMIEKQHYSERIAGEIDTEINKILSQSLAKCKEIILEYRTYLDKIADALIEKEVLEYEEFNEIVADILVKPT